MSWLVAGALLLAAEAPVPGLYLMWLGLAALGTGALTLWLGLALARAVAVFAALAALAVALGWRVRARAPAPALNTPRSGLVGRPATALGFVGAEGRVRVGDSDWPARAEDGAAPAPGAALRVVGVEGMILLVQAATRHTA